MKSDPGETKKRRKVNDAALEIPVKKKKLKNPQAADTDLELKNGIVETPGEIAQDDSHRDGKKKEKKKKRKREEIDENAAVEKKPKTGIAAARKTIQNGEVMNSTGPDNSPSGDHSENEDKETQRVSTKEAKTLSGKSLRKSFNSREGLDTLSKFLAICKENKERDLAAEYLQAGGSVLEILRLLDTSDKKNVNNASVVFAAMHLIIMKILSEYPQYQSNAEEACRHFINSHLSFVHGMLSSQSNAKHRKIVLRLLASMVSLGGSLPRELLAHLSFHTQVLETLSQHTKPTDSQSVRTCFVHFVLAFLVEGNASVVRAMLDKRGMLSCLFPGLTYDSHLTVHLVLDTVKTWVLENPAISKTSKLHVFSTPVLQSLVGLYNWKGPKNWPGPNAKKRDAANDIVNPEEKAIAVEAVHTFLTTLLTSNRHGVIFHDRTLGTSGRKYNQLVNTVLQSLDRPWEHEKPRDLVMKILIACPDLVRAQLAYTEPFLEPRASKKWIAATRFVGELIDSLEAENYLEPCLSELPSSQLIGAAQSLTIPLVVLKTTVVPSLNDVHSTTIRHEGVALLTIMLRRAAKFAKIVERLYHEADFLVFRNSMIDYISKNVPSLETILGVWNSALAPDEEHLDRQEIAEFAPRRHDHFIAILDLLEVYRELCPERLDLSASGDRRSENLLAGLDQVPETEPGDLTRTKVKSLKFLLSVDLAAFSPRKSLFGQTLAFLLTLLGPSDEESKPQCRDTIRMLLSTSGMFEGCLEQIDIWIESFATLECSEEKIKVANWFIKIVQQAIKRTDKYLDLVAEAEESAGEQILTAGKLDDIFSELYEDDAKNAFGRVTNVAPMTLVSPILCSAIESLKKIPDETNAKYLSYVTSLTLHCQVSPGTLVQLARGVEDFPGYKYLTSWLPDEKPTSLKRSFFATSLVGKLSKALLNSESIEIDQIFQGSRTVDFEYRGKKIRLRHDLGIYEVTILLRMTLFYATQFMQRGELSEERFDSHKMCIIALMHVAKDLSDVDSKLIYRCSRVIFTHPIVLQYFSPFCKSKNVVEKIVTAGLLNVFQTVVDLDLGEDVISDLFLPFKNKFVAQLSLAAKKCKNGKNVKNSLFPMEFAEILRPTSKDIVDALRTIVELPKTCFIADKTELSIWGNLVPKFIGLLTERKNNLSTDSTVDTVVVKKIVSYLIQLKVQRGVRMDSWEKNLQGFLERYPQNIADIDGHAFNCLLKRPKSSTTVHLLSFLVSRNDRYIPLFVQFVSNDTEILAESDLIVSVVASRLTYPWNQSFLKKIHDHYKDDIVRYFAEPSTDKNWPARNTTATAFLLDSCFELEDCKRACETVLTNGEKLDNVDLSYVKLVESLFKKRSKLENDSEEPLTQLVQVLIRIAVSTLKKDSKNEEKLEALCQSLRDTIDSIKSKNSDFISEELSKNYSWPQFTRFTLKLGLKTSKENKKHVSLLRTLVSVCDVAYKDGSEHEYVKTLFEMATSHSEFVNLMLSSQSVKRDLLELLWILVRKNHSTMSSSQIPLYLAAYEATLGESDQFVLLILQHYEANGIKLNEYKPYLWGEAAATHYSVKGEADTALWRQPSTSQVLDLLNAETIRDTIKYFPVHRELKPLGLCEARKVYDPSFYLPLLSYLLSDNNVVACHKVTQSGALALAFAASGSSCAEIRLAAYTIVSRFYFHLEATSSKEKRLWIHFLDALRNGILDMDSSLKDVRTSCLASTFLARAALVTTQPMDPLYPRIQTFLMAKPALELNAIPELLQLFHSSDVEHRTHRHWILEVMRDGMRTYFDMEVALRCVVFKMLLDFYTSVLADSVTKRLILQIIESTVKIPRAGLLLSRSYGLLAWLNGVAANLTNHDTESVVILVSIVRAILNAVMRTNDRDKDLQFLLLNVLKTVTPCLSKNTSVHCYKDYTSSLSEILQTKSFRVALSRGDLEKIVDLGNLIYGDVDDIMDVLRSGGEFSSRTEDSGSADGEATSGRASLRKLVLTWCGHGAR